MPSWSPAYCYPCGEYVRKHPRRARPKISKRTRALVLKMDNYSCRRCGVGWRDHPAIRLEIDHRVPLAKGGTNDITNLQVLCWSCNSKKGAQMEVVEEE